MRSYRLRWFQTGGGCYGDARLGCPVAKVGDETFLKTEWIEASPTIVRPSFEMSLIR